MKSHGEAVILKELKEIKSLQLKELKEIKVIQKQLVVILGKLRPSGQFNFAVGPVTNKQPRKAHIMLEVQTTNEEKILVTLKPMTGGTPPKPAKVDGVPAWEVVSGPSTIEPSEDGMSAQCVSSDDADTDTQYKVTADADLGEGVEEISDIISYHVTSAKAANVGLTAGEITSK